MLGIDDAGTSSITYREIKRRIVDLYYEVGERLSETRLAEDLGVGRSPVRTALLRLKSEGWIDISPQSGTYIKALTPHEIREVADLRALLEMRAASVAAMRISDDVLRELRAEFIERERDVNNGEADAFIAMDNRLHAAIYDVTDNSLIRNILLDLRDKVQWIRRVCAVSNERVQDGYKELERILAALEQRDEGQAASAMRDHVKSAAAFCEQLEVQKLRRQPRARFIVDQLRSSIAPFENETPPAGAFGKDI
ncbi:DNA-binding GntR family transcriptional regulator [Nitrobacteraceae bacterium AZCC 1564]